MRNEALVCEDKALSSSSSFLPEAYPTIAYPYGTKVDTSERQESLRLTFLYAVVHIPCDSNRTDNNNLMLTAVSNQQQSIFAITFRITPLTVRIRSESQFERFHRVIPDANHHVIALFPLEGRTEIAPKSGSRALRHFWNGEQQHGGYQRPTPAVLEVRGGTWKEWGLIVDRGGEAQPAA